MNTNSPAGNQTTEKPTSKNIKEIVQYWNEKIDSGIIKYGSKIIITFNLLLRKKKKWYEWRPFWEVGLFGYPNDNWKTVTVTGILYEEQRENKSSIWSNLFWIKISKEEEDKLDKIAEENKIEKTNVCFNKTESCLYFGIQFIDVISVTCEEKELVA